MKSVTLIAGTFQTTVGGGQVQALRQARQLLANGWDVQILSRASTHPVSLEDDLHIVEIVPTKTNLLSDIVFVFRSLNYLRQYRKRGIYHAHGEGLDALVAVLAQWLFRGYALIKLRNNFHYYRQRYSNPVAWLLFIQQLKSARRVIAISSDIAASLGRIIRNPKKIVFIPNGIDIKQFSPPSTTLRTKARSSLGIQAEQRVVLCVGTLKTRKGIDVLIHAWHKLSANVRENSLLVIIGEGEQRSELETLINRYTLASSVRFAGHQADVSTYYKAADIFVLPSRHEGLSNALLEAAAFGLPLIGTNISGTSDVIEHGINGMICEVDDADTMRSHIETLLEDKSKRLQMGTEARNTVADKMNISVVVEALEDLYLHLLQNKKV